MNWCGSWNSNTLATWCKELTYLNRPRCWERLKAGGEGDDRGWEGWMASLTQWTWTWVNSGSSRWTGRAGVLQSLRSQRVRHDWVMELKRTRGHRAVYDWPLTWHSLDWLHFSSLLLCSHCSDLSHQSILWKSQTYKTFICTSFLHGCIFSQVFQFFAQIESHLKYFPDYPVLKCTFLNNHERYCCCCC